MGPRMSRPPAKAEGKGWRASMAPVHRRLGRGAPSLDRSASPGASPNASPPPPALARAHVPPVVQGVQARNSRPPGRPPRRAAARRVRHRTSPDVSSFRSRRPITGSHARSPCGKPAPRPSTRTPRSRRRTRPSVRSGVLTGRCSPARTPPGPGGRRRCGHRPVPCSPPLCPWPPGAPEARPAGACAGIARPPRPPRCGDLRLQVATARRRRARLAARPSPVIIISSWCSEWSTRPRPPDSTRGAPAWLSSPPPPRGREVGVRLAP